MPQCPEWQPGEVAARAEGLLTWTPGVSHSNKTLEHTITCIDATVRTYESVATMDMCSSDGPCSILLD